MRCHFIPVSVAVTNKPAKDKGWQEVETREPSCTVSGTGDGAASVGNGREVPQEIKRRTNMQPRNTTLG